MSYSKYIIFSIISYTIITILSKFKFFLRLFFFVFKNTLFLILIPFLSFLSSFVNILSKNSFGIINLVENFVIFISLIKSFKEKSEAISELGKVSLLLLLLFPGNVLFDLLISFV